MENGIKDAKLMQEFLHEHFSYDPDTGVFVRIKLPKGHNYTNIGSIAGSLNGGKYFQIKIKNVPYTSHRLAWVYVYGYWPSEIDHIDGNRQNNSIKNLRECTRSINQKNIHNSNKNNFSTGVRGVTLCKHVKKRPYHAQIRHKGIKHSLGYYETLEEAEIAYLETKQLFEE